jgi:radical SAM protein with 4Fe4S-binding SPASM domain
MEDSMGDLFDNVLLRTRGEGCLLSSVARPFTTVYWPELSAVLHEVGLDGEMGGTLERPGARERFLLAVTAKDLGERFKPGRIGFARGPDELRAAEKYRQSHRVVTLMGPCPSRVALRAIELAASQVRPGAVVDVQIRDWDALAERRSAWDFIAGVCAFLYRTQGLTGQVTIFSQLKKVDDGLAEFIYHYPMVRVAWVAEELLPCVDEQSAGDLLRQCPALANLRRISDAGLWPHIVLPVGRSNVQVLEELVVALINESHGGSLELAPIEFLAPTTPARLKGMVRSESLGAGLADADPAPAIEEYSETLLRIWRNRQIPIDRVSPLSWVATRVNSEGPLPISAMDAGVAIAVLPNGDIYCGEWSVGLGEWRLGNVLEEDRKIRWERLDILPETLLRSPKAQKCRTCEWRYRCGGAPSSLALLAKRDGLPVGEGGASSIPDPVFDLYCEPRRRLFEELIWEWADAGMRGTVRQQVEGVELTKTGVEFAALARDGQPLEAG